MRRRELLGSCAGGISFVVAGCGQFVHQPPPSKDLRIRVESVHPTETGWQLRIETNVAPVRDSIPEVTLVAFAENERLACEKAISDLRGGRKEHELDCQRFPAIISARTSLDCDRENVQIVYWVGPDELQQQRMPEDLGPGDPVFQNTEQECGEPLPPERVVTAVREAPTETESQ